MSPFSKDARALAPHNDLITRIHTTFVDKADVDCGGIHVYVGYRGPHTGKSSIPAWAILGASDIWVDRFAAILNIPQHQTITVRGGHTRIVKPHIKQESVYLFVKGILEKIERLEHLDWRCTPTSSGFSVKYSRGNRIFAFTLETDLPALPAALKTRDHLEDWKCIHSVTGRALSLLQTLADEYWTPFIWYNQTHPTGTAPGFFAIRKWAADYLSFCISPRLDAVHADISALSPKVANCDFIKSFLQQVQGLSNFLMFALDKDASDFDYPDLLAVADQARSGVQQRFLKVLDEADTILQTHLTRTTRRRVRR